ncbi:MAG: hypothetical protein AAGF55_06380, partial [Pseudomonadota bacterium]
YPLTLLLPLGAEIVAFPAFPEQHPPSVSFLPSLLADRKNFFFCNNLLEQAVPYRPWICS